MTALLRMASTPSASGAPPPVLNALRDVLVVSRAPQHATLPEGRSSRRLPRRWLGGFSDATKEAADLLGVGDQGDEAHAPVAARAAENVDREAALEQLGPRAIPRAPRLGRRTERARLDVVGRRRGRFGHDARAQLARGGQNPRVTDGVQAGGGTEAASRQSRDSGSMSTATVPSEKGFLSAMRTSPSGLA